MTNLEQYQLQQYQFSIIAAVLDGSQQGIVLSNDSLQPTHFFVIHQFGFCQEFFTDFDEHFFKTIQKLILERKYKKLRCYAPSDVMSSFLRTLYFASESERMKLYFKNNTVRNKCVSDGSQPGLLKQADTENTCLLAPTIEAINTKNLMQFDFGLNLIGRYWRDANDFLNKAIAFGAFYHGVPAGVCYSAALGLQQAEIDILVAKQYTRNYVGFRLGSTFIDKCINLKLVPSWDCYSNNAPSIKLAFKLGFDEQYRYRFYNIFGN